MSRVFGESEEKVPDVTSDSSLPSRSADNVADRTMSDVHVKVCSRCGGVVHVTITRRQRPGGVFVSYAEGVCQSCGHRFDEAEILALEGPSPVGG